MNTFLYKKENNLIDKEQITKLLDRFNEIHQNKIYNNSGVSHIFELKRSDIEKEPLFKFLLNVIEKKIKFLSNLNDLSIKKMWLVNSTPNNQNKNFLPYIPHIDKQRYLKAMVYLHDVSFNHGPIYLGKLDSSVDIEKIRKKLPYNYKEKGLNSIKYQQLDGSLIPMVGNAGDVIFFDTNTPHKAGIVKDNYSRKVLRFDFENLSFNKKPTFLKKIFNKINISV